jgi:hypothetical protein
MSNVLDVSLTPDEIKVLESAETSGKITDRGRQILNLVRQNAQVEGQIDWSQGAPASVRIALSLAKTPEFKTKYLQKLYGPDSVRTVGGDPENIVFRDSTGKWRAVGEEGFNFKDVMDMAPDLASAGVGAVGGMLAGPLGAGAATGGMAILNKILGRSMGLQPPESLGQSALDVGIETALGTGGEVATKVGGAGLKKGLGFLASYGKAASPFSKEVMRLGEEAGVPLLAPDITGSRFQSILFSSLDKLMGGSGVMQRAGGETVEKLGQYGERVLERFGGKLSPEVAGEMAKRGMKQTWRNVKLVSDDLYGQVASKAQAKGIVVEMKEAGKVADNIINSREFKYLDTETKSRIKLIIDDLKENIPFKDADDIRKSVGGVSFPSEVSGTRGQGLANKILSAIDNDMERAASKAGSDVLDTLKEARRFNKEYIFGVYKGETKNFQKAIGTKILHSNDEDILKMISKGNITELRQVQQVLPPDAMTGIKQAWLTDLFKNSQTIVRTQKGEIESLSGSKLTSALKGYGDEYLKVMFDPDELKAIKDLALLARATGTAEKLAGNPSGTAQTIMAGSLLTGAGAGIGSTQGRQGAVIGGVGGMASPFLLAKLITSSFGRKWMTTGFKAGFMREAGGRFIWQNALQQLKGAFPSVGP